MKLPRLPKIKWNYTAMSFLLPFLGMMGLMLVCGYIPFSNEKSMLYSDMWHQYYPFFRDFRSNLLNGDGLLYNWSIGMGLDYLGLISYYLASPLNLLCLLVPESLTLHCFALLMPVKLGLAGLFFAIFLKGVFGKNDLSICLFSGFYALCAWALGYQWNVMWLDSFALLPLVALGTVRLLKDQKYILYTVSLFFAIFANYYIGFFVCIFVLLVFICYQICRCKSAKAFFSDLLRIALFSALAIGMTAVLELPALSALQTTQSSVNTFPDYFSLNIVDYDLCAAARDAWDAFKAAKETGEGNLIVLWLTAMKESFPPIFSAMKEVVGNMNGGLTPTLKEGLPNLYTGVGTTFLAFLFLTAKRVKLRDKICSVVLLLFFMLSFIIRQLDYIWHGFHFTNMIPYRFSFLYSFVLLYMAYRAFLLRNTFKPWHLFTAGILSFGVILCSEQTDDLIFLVYNGVFFLLYFGILFFYNLEFPIPEDANRDTLRRILSQRKMRRSFAGGALALTMFLELVVNVANFGVNFPYTGINNYPQGTENTASMIRYMLEDDSPFYRAETTHSQTLNDGALNGYNGISAFTSSANVKVTEFMQHLGYGAKNTYNRYCFEESSPVANLFLNLKYMLERNAQVEENPYFTTKHSYNNVYLLENNNYLPLGFLAENALGEFGFHNYGGAFVLQNYLFSAATGAALDVWRTDFSNILTIESSGTNITNQTITGFVAYEKSPSASTLIYRYEMDETGFLCLDLTMSAGNTFTVWKNDKQLYSENIGLPQTLSVCQVRPGDIIELKITIKSDTSGNITVRPGLLNDAVFQEGYEVLAASTLDITEFSSTKVTGSIDCNRDGLLYTSIPQDGNWSVTVDGKPTRITLVGDAMIAVNLTKGEHDVVFTYRNRAFETGLTVSLACLFIFLSVIVIDNYPKFKDRLPKFKK